MTTIPRPPELEYIFVSITTAVELLGCSILDMYDYIKQGKVRVSPIRRHPRDVFAVDIYNLWLPGAAERIAKQEADIAAYKAYQEAEEIARYGIPFENLPPIVHKPINCLVLSATPRPVYDVPVPLLPIKKYFVYTLRRPNNTVFYVGKGTKNRPYQHLTEAERGDCICDKCKFIQHIWRRRKQVYVNYEFSTDDEKEALKHETKLIKELSATVRLYNKMGNHPYNPEMHKLSVFPRMNKEEYTAYLEKMDVFDRRQRDKLLKQWADERTQYLYRKWATLRRRQEDEESAKIDAEIAELNVFRGEVWQEKMF